MRAGDQRLGVVAVGRRSPGCSFSSVASVSDARIRRSAAFATPVSSSAGSRLHACRPALPPRHWPERRPVAGHASAPYTVVDIPTRASERRSRRTCECCGQRKKRAGAGSWSWRTPTGARSCSQRCTRRNPGVPAGTAYAQGRLSEEINGSLRAPKIGQERRLEGCSRTRTSPSVMSYIARGGVLGVRDRNARVRECSHSEERRRVVAALGQPAR